MLEDDSDDEELQRVMNDSLTDSFYHYDASKVLPIPTMVYNGNANITCTICLVDFVCGSPCKEIDCKHIFHATCLTQAYKYSDKCPNCRRTIPRGNLFSP